MIYAKFQNSTILRANKIHSPDGIFDASKDDAPDGWYLVEKEDDITDSTINGIPVTITRMRAMLILKQMDLLDSVINAVESIGGNTKIAFDNALDFERDSPFINQMTELLGLTDSQVDDMYVSANNLDLK